MRFMPLPHSFRAWHCMFMLSSSTLSGFRPYCQKFRDMDPDNFGRIGTHVEVQEDGSSRETYEWSAWALGGCVRAARSGWLLPVVCVDGTYTQTSVIIEPAVSLCGPIALPVSGHGAWACPMPVCVSTRALRAAALLHRGFCYLLPSCVSYAA